MCVLFNPLTTLRTWSTELDQKTLEAVNAAIANSHGEDDPFEQAAADLRRCGFGVDTAAVRSRYQRFLSPQAQMLRKQVARKWSIAERSRLMQLVDG